MNKRFIRGEVGLEAVVIVSIAMLVLVVVLAACRTTKVATTTDQTNTTNAAFTSITLPQGQRLIGAEYGARGLTVLTRAAKFSDDRNTYTLSVYGTTGAVAVVVSKINIIEQ